MAKVKIEGNASGTGTFTIAAPNSNSDRTLTLPDEAGTVLTSAGVPAAALPAGSVLQVVQGTYSTQVDVGSTSWTSTGLSASITPSSTSSKILVHVSQSAEVRRDNTAAGGAVALFRDSTRIAYAPSGDAGDPSMYLDVAGSGTTFMQHRLYYPLVYLDSPSSTSSITYSTKGAAWVGSGSLSNAIKFNVAGNHPSYIVLMEIAG